MNPIRQQPLHPLRSAVEGTRERTVLQAVETFTGPQELHDILAKADEACLRIYLELAENPEWRNALEETVGESSDSLLRTSRAFALGRRAVLLAEQNRWGEAQEAARLAATVWNEHHPMGTVESPQQGSPVQRLSGPEFVGRVLRDLGQRDGLLVGPVRDLVGPARWRRRIHADIPLLLYVRGSSSGQVLRLRLEALEDGLGECYPHARDMDGHPIRACFHGSVRRAWEEATRWARKDGSPWVCEDRWTVDVRWTIFGAVDRQEKPLPVEGRSAGGAFLVAFYRLLRDLVPLADRAISVCLGEEGLDALSPAELEAVGGAFAKAKAGQENRVRYFLLHPDNGKSVLDAGVAEQCFLPAKTIPDLLDGIRYTRDRDTDRLAPLRHGLAQPIRAFLAAYLGNDNAPVPFGGREEVLRQLDEWLVREGDDSRRLVAAPMGLGKSALLARWVDRLSKRGNEDFHLVYVPVSNRFGTNKPDDLLKKVASHLREVISEPVAGFSPRDEVGNALEVLANQADAKRVLLVLDGVDEALGELVDRTMFARRHRRLRVVVAARSAHPKGEDWREKLAWNPSEVLTLQPLTDSGIGQALAGMGCPLDELAERNDLLAELRRLTRGDPLELRMRVDALWAKRNAVGGMGYADLVAYLRTQGAGLQGIFDEFWKDQEKIWRGHQTFEFETEKKRATELFHVLATAYGPLSVEDLKRLTDSQETDAEMRDRLESLHRFVVRNAESTYSLQHPRFREFFLTESKRLSDAEKRALSRRFVDWGLAVGNALNANDPWQRECPGPARSVRSGQAIDRVPDYLVKYLGQHMDDQGTEAEHYRELLTEGWYGAWQRLEQGGSNNGFLADLRRCVLAFRRGNQAAAEQGRALPLLAEELCATLIRCTLESLDTKVPMEMLTELVKGGTWSSENALRFAERLPTDMRGRALLVLARWLPEEWLGEVERLAWMLDATHSDEALRVRLAIADRVSGPYRARLVGEVDARGNAPPPSRPADDVLASLLRFYPASERLERIGRLPSARLRDQARLDAVRELPAPAAIPVAQQVEDKSARDEAFGLVAEKMPPHEAIQFAESIDGPKIRFDTMMAALGRMGACKERSKGLERALAVAREIESGAMRWMAPIGAAKRYLKPEAARELAGLIADPGVRCAILVDAAQRAAGEERLELLKAARETATQIVEPSRRREVNEEIDQVGAPASALACAPLARSTNDPRTKAKILMEAARRMEPTAAATLARSIDDTRIKAHALAEAASRMAVGQERDMVLAEAVQSARAIDHPQFKAEALVEAASRMAVGQERDRVLTEAVQSARSMDHPQTRANALVEAATQMAVGQERDVVLAEAVQSVHSINDPGITSSALMEAARRMEPAAAAALARSVDLLMAKVKILMEAASRMEPATAAALARSIDLPMAKVIALAGAASRMTVGQERDMVLAEAVRFARAIDHPRIKAHALAAAASRMVVGQERDAILADAVQSARSIDDPQFKAEALVEAASWMAVGQERDVVLAEAVQSTDSIGHPPIKVNILAEAARQMEPAAAATLARSIDFQLNKVIALAEAASRMAVEQEREVVLTEAVQFARSIDDPQTKAEALVAAASRMVVGQERDVVLADAVQSARSIDDPQFRANALMEAARRMDPATAAALARSIDDLRTKVSILTDAVKRLEVGSSRHELLQQAFTACLELSVPERLVPLLSLSEFMPRPFPAWVRVAVCSALAAVQESFHERKPMLENHQLLDCLRLFGVEGALGCYAKAILDVCRRWP